MTTAPAAQDNNERIKALAEDIARLIWNNKVDDAIQKFRAESNDDRYAILMDGDPGVLHLAAGCNRVDAITAMLDGLSADRRLAAITAVNTNGYNPLHRAAYNGRVDAITVMLDGLSADRRLAVITAVDTEGSTPLHVAAYNGHAGAIIAMLGGLLPEHHLAAMMVPNMFRRTPLHEAAYNGRVNAITTMLARLNVAQCRDALFNLEYGVGTKLAQEYAKNAQHADAQRYLDTLINGVVPLIPFGNDKKELITGILQKVTEINPQAQIPSAAVKYLDTPKTVGGYLQGLQGSFAQAATADTTTVPGKDHTPGAKGDTGVHKCKMRRIRYGCEPRS